MVIREITKELQTLGSEESQMYCVCRDRMKKNSTSWSLEGAEAILKVITNKMNETIKKNKQEQIIYAGKDTLANNFVGGTKEFIIDLLKSKKCSELMLIN